MDRADEQRHHQIERKYPKLAGGHSSFQPRSHQSEKHVVLFQKDEWDIRGTVARERLLQEKCRRPWMPDQPPQVAIDGFPDASLRGRISGEKDARASLILVENGVVKGGDQLVLGAEVVVEGSNAHRPSAANLFHKAARLTDIEHRGEGRIEDHPPALSSPPSPLRHHRH